MKPDYDLISGALKSWYYNFVGELVLSAKNTYVATSIASDSLALKRHGIVSDELRELGFEKAKKIDAPMLKEMKDLYSEKSREFTDPYKADLMNGGRFVNIGKWGDLNDDKFREYEGYERKWVPWLENYDKTQRESIYGIVTSGKSKEEIAAELERNFNMRKNYAQMVARTESYNNSAIIKRDRWDKAGYEFFKWICSHSTNSPCLILCAQFCGRTFHRSELPFNGELAHANCVVPETEVYSPSGYMAATKVWYSGPVITIHFRTGKVTVTPNHMFLTNKGFASADVIMEGDYVIKCTFPEGVSSGDMNAHNSVTKAEDCFNSLIMFDSVRTAEVPVSSKDFHGDSAFCKENVDVVFTERFLREDINPIIIKHLNNINFSIGSKSHISFFNRSPLNEFFIRSAFTSDGCMSSSRKPASFFRGRICHSNKHCITSTSDFDSSLYESAFDSFPHNSGIFMDLENGLPAVITLDEVVGIDVTFYSGHVYDFQTDSTLYISNGYINSNCRCTIVPVLKDTIPDEWKNLKPESTWAERRGDEPRFVPPEYKSPFLKDQIGRDLPNIPVLDSDLPGKLKLDKGIDDVLKDVVGTGHKKSVDDIYKDVVGVYDKKKNEYAAMKAMKAQYDIELKNKDILRTKYFNENASDELYSKLVNERNELERAKIDLLGNMSVIRKEGRKEIVELLKTGEKNKIAVNLSQFKIAGESKRIEEGLEFLESVSSKDLVSSIPHKEVKLVKIKIGDRAGASRAGGYIEIAANDGPEVIVHEMGHIFDGLNDSDRFNHALDFYERRTKGETPMEIWKGSGEYAKKDKFIELYTGKQYASKSSEVTSMGLQHLYEMPGEFAIKDPDHFKYIMKVLRYDLT